MKKLLFIMIAICLGSNITSFAKNKSTTVNGSADVKDQNYDNLTVNGRFSGTNIRVENSIQVNGSITVQNLKCKQLTSNGNVDVNELQAEEIEINGSFSGKSINVSGKSKFSGRGKITNGKLHAIEITSKEFTLIDTEINGDICIKKNKGGWSFSSKPSVAILELKGDTIINGNITFEEDGEIHLFDKAKIKGKVVNAKIIKK